MSITSTTRGWLRAAGLYETASRAWMWLEPRSTNAIRAISGKNERLTRAYLASTRQPGLHIGCGDNHLAGWLNTELCPRRHEIFLDATRPFPFADDTFAFVYSEHMIEHVPYDDGAAMLRECFRVLRPGGTARIVTPDLAFLRALLDDAPHPQRDAYMAFYQRHNRLDDPFTVTHLVNHFVRAWGHQFIYDRGTLAGLLRSVGFEDVEPQELLDSRIAELRGLAKIDRMPEGFLEMESLTVEARKPPR